MSLEKVTASAWKVLEEAVVTLDGRRVGTVAARDPVSEGPNYDRVFVRDFFVAGLAFLLRGDAEIVSNFLVEVGVLQGRQRHMDWYRPGHGLMPANFSVEEREGKEKIVADFGEHSIARVTPIDSGLWWLLLLRIYTKLVGDRELAEREPVQDAVRGIIDHTLTSGLDMLPTLLVPDGAFTIDRRLGVYGHPLDIQALLIAALRSASELLPEGDELQEAVSEHLGQLVHHLRQYYWLDLHRLNEIYRFQVEESGDNAANAFNIYPDSIPDWIMTWLPLDSGYFVANLGPARMDFRFLAQGNLLSVLIGLATSDQRTALMRLLEERWDDLVGEMPMKLCYPAVEGRDWQLITGSDPKNTPWSYHNGGSWPFLIWLLAAAALQADRRELVERALEPAAEYLDRDGWPEYYDGRLGRLIGKQARRNQVWSAAGFLVAQQLLEDPGKLDLMVFEGELESDSSKNHDG